MTAIDNMLARLGLVDGRKLEELKLEFATLKAEMKKTHRWLGETADAQRWDMSDPIIYANQADLYRLDPVLGSAISILSNDVGTATFNVMRMVGEETRDIPNHPFELLLRNPNPMDSGLEFTRDTVSNYMSNGNSTWWLNRPDRFTPPEEMWTIPFSQLEVVPDGKLYISHYNYYPGNGKPAIPIPTWEIVHFKMYNPNNRFVGLSPIESLVQTIQGDLGMRATQTRNYVEFGGSPQSILAFKDFVPNESWEDIKTEKRQAAMRNEMMMLRGVGDGVTWMSRAMSNRDSEYIAILKQNTVDIFNRIAPGLVAMLSENATEANALAARATYSEKTLWVVMEAIAQKITSDILPAYGRKLIGKYDDPRVVDRKLKLEEQAAYERSHTLKEVRKEYYNDEPLEDERDDLLVSQINATSGGVQESQIPTVLKPDNQDEVQQNTVLQKPAESVSAGNESEDVAVKAVVEDLQRWRRMALRGKGKALEFTSVAIPVKTMANIRAKVKTVSDKEILADVFDRAILAAKTRSPKDAHSVLRGILAGIQAMEIKNAS